MAKTPRNLRQVGNPGENLSIYIEDYVFTYLKSEYNTEAAILIGESCYEENGIKVFVRGVISCPQLFWREEGMEITQRTWNYIFREREHLYNNQEIVGWYLPVPSEDEERTLIALGEFHGRYFPGADKVFFYLNQKQGEEAFFVKEGAIFKRQPGYYVFYEKNTTMREYMLALREERQLEADLYKEVHDKPRETIRYREYIHAELEKKNKQSGGVAYGLGIVSLVAVFALVIGMVSGYRELDGMEKFFRAVESALNIEIRESDEDGQPQDDVETIVAGSISENTQSGNSSLNIEDTENEDSSDEASEETGQDENNSSIIEGTQFDTEVDDTDTEVAMALAQGYYVVKQGEGLAEICRKLYGDDKLLEAICQKNNIENPDTIYPGQIIYLP